MLHQHDGMLAQTATSRPFALFFRWTMYGKRRVASNCITLIEQGGISLEQSRWQKRKNKRKTYWKIGGIILALFLISSYMAVQSYIATRDIRELDHPLPAPTIIYDQNGRVASKISSSKMEAVSIEHIPNHFLEAVVATEDRRFYDHEGIDYFGILRALIRNMKAGEWVEGGSTITQQLAKNVFLTNEKTLRRKWEEWFIAKKIERTYSKKEILEMYVNRVYFGEGAWGVQSAAKTYFGKDVSKLTVSEAALLAGLIKAPSALSPVSHYEKAIARRNIVLQLMKEQGYIDEQTFLRAKNEKIVVQKEKKPDRYKGKYPYYVDQLIEEAIARYHITQNEVLSGGLHIYTELNPRMQEGLETVYQNDTLFPKGTEDRLVQSGAVLLDPKTGGIKALIGGRGEHVFRGFNRATQLKRQPGSTMKPLAVYTPALEQGYHIFDELKDEPIEFNGYRPENYDHTYRGSVTMYEAVIHSLNVPAVWLLNEIGLEKGIDALQRFGIPLDKEDHSLGIALGGMRDGVSPLQMAEAYSVFPNDGVRTDAHIITKIVDQNGNEIAKWKPHDVRVTSKEVAQKITFMLEGVVKEGTGKLARIPGRALAGKTGSTQVPLDGVNGVKDQWMVGYTPQLVGAVWLGYDHTDERHYLQTTSSQTVAVIFREIMEKALEGTPAQSFAYPALKKEQKQWQQWHKQQKEKEEEEKREKEEKWEHEHGPKEKREKEKRRHHWHDKHEKKQKEKEKGKGKGKGHKHDNDEEDD
jgi:penicillin-binding protein 2A